MRKSLIAAFALLAFSSVALAQSSAPVILSGGCGTGNFPTGSGFLTLDSTGHLCGNVNGTVTVNGAVTSTPATPAAGTLGAGYPPGSTPINASATGTTAGTTATLASNATKFTYICGFSVSPGSAATAITIAVTVTGITNTFTESVGAPVTAVGTTGLDFTRTFTPCVASSAINTGIAVAAGALGVSGVNQAVNAWGFQQ